MNLTAMSSLESVRRKVFMNDVHHLYKVAMKSFWAEEAEMSVTAISLFESTRKKFFMNSTYIMSRK